MDKANKGSLSLTSIQQISMQGKKPSHDDKIKMSEQCFRKNESTQYQLQNKPYFIQTQENNNLYLKNQNDERRFTSIEQEMNFNTIQKQQQQNTDNQNKNSQLIDQLNNAANTKALKINNTPKGTIQNNLQIAKNLKIPNKASSILQQQNNQIKKSHLKHQTLTQSRAQVNLTENDEQKQIQLTNSASPQPRNNLSSITAEILKQQQIQAYSQRDNRQQPKKLGEKKKYSMDEKADLKFDCNNKKKQRNRSEQMQPMQFLTLTNQNKFCTLQRQKQDIVIDFTKKDREQSHDKFKTEQYQRKDNSKDQMNNEIQNNQIYLRQNYLLIQNEGNSNLKNYKKESISTKSNENLFEQNTIHTSKDRKNNSKESSSSYSLKETDIQKFSLLFLQQQKKQLQKGSKKQSLCNPIKKESNTIASDTQDQNQTKSLKYPQLNTLIQQLQTAQSKKPLNYILIQDNQEEQSPQEVNLLIKSERNNNESSKSPDSIQYGRISNREILTQYNIVPQQQNYMNIQNTQPKQNMVSLNSRQSIIVQQNFNQDNEDIAMLQQLSQPLLTSSSSNKEPNRRYEKQTFDKKNEIDKKIKDYLESKQHNTSQDLSSRQCIPTTPSIIATSINNNNSSNMNSKSSNSNNLLNSNLLNSNLQYPSKENSNQPSSNSNYLQIQVNEDNLEESQIHFFAEDPSVYHNSQGDSIKKSNILKQNSQDQQFQNSNYNNIQNDLNSNNTPHRQKKIQLKSSINCQIITPSTCDGKQQVTLVSPIISNFMISPSSKVISLSPKPYLTTDNEEIEDTDMVISFSENINTEESLDFPHFQNKQNEEQKKYEQLQSNNKTNEAINKKQDIINTKLEQRLGALEIEMSSIISRCVNLEVQNKSLTSNIDKVTFEKNIIRKENEIYVLKIEELTMINKQQEETISQLLTRIHHQKSQDQTYLNISELQTKRNKTDYSHFNANTQNSTVELSAHLNTENTSSFSQNKECYKSDPFSSARGVPINSKNNLKAKKEINQYFSNMMNNNQSKQMQPQTFQGYLSQKNLSNFAQNSQTQTNNSLSQNDSITNNKYIFTQSTKNQQQQQQQQISSIYKFQNVNFEDEQAQASSYRNDYYLSNRHGVKDQYKY